MTVKGCCLEWEQEITLYMDRELASSSQARVERHLKKCGSCSHFYRELEREEQWLAGQLRNQMDDVFFAPDFADSVMNALPAYQPNPLVQQYHLFLQRMHDFFAFQGYRHLVLACSILVCVAGSLMTLRMGEVVDLHTILVKHNGNYISKELPSSFFIQPRGDRSRGEFFELPDTSLIYATPGTMFTVNNYPESNEDNTLGTERLINLNTGEVFVDVHPAREGFSVVCTNAKIKVFGTQFLVSFTPGMEKNTLIAVREGDVMVEKLENNQTVNTYTKLSAGMMTKVVSQNGKVILHPPEPISADLLDRLDQFDESRSNRSIQRTVPTKSPFDNSDLLGTDDLLNPLSQNNFPAKMSE